MSDVTVSPEGRKLLRLEVRNSQTPIERKPEWIKTRAVMGPEYKELKSLVKREGLHTVCEEAGCPNIYECWEDREATFLIGGDQCTRRCDFCQIDTGKPLALDRERRVRRAHRAGRIAVEHHRGQFGEAARLPLRRRPARRFIPEQPERPQQPRVRHLASGKSRRRRRICVRGSGDPCQPSSRKSRVCHPEHSENGGRDIEQACAFDGRLRRDAGAGGQNDPGRALPPGRDHHRHAIGTGDVRQTSDQAIEEAPRSGDHAAEGGLAGGFEREPSLLQNRLMDEDGVRRRFAALGEHPHGCRLHGGGPRHAELESPDRVAVFLAVERGGRDQGSEHGRRYAAGVDTPNSDGVTPFGRRAVQRQRPAPRRNARGLGKRVVDVEAAPLGARTACRPADGARGDAARLEARPDRIDPPRRLADRTQAARPRLLVPPDAVDLRLDSRDDRRRGRRPDAGRRAGEPAADSLRPQRRQTRHLSGQGLGVEPRPIHPGRADREEFGHAAMRSR